MRQVWAASAAPPGKLQHHHTRRADGFAQLHNVLSDDPQVLSHNGGAADRLLDPLKEPQARTHHPRAALGRLGGCRDGPVRGEGTEVVDAHLVVQLQRAPQPASPPPIPLPLVCWPVVQRVPPQLPVLTEGVGWNPRHGRGLALAVQEEQILIGPHIRRLPPHVDGHVAHKCYPLGVGVGFQRQPLVVEEKLRSGELVHGGGGGGALGRQRRRLAAPQLFRPVPPVPTQQLGLVANGVEERRLV
mmetsp:Transcript_22700/g.56261  ORF Transcript_22700/g.56261 Transcript_22700/m.56261 type:complete len:244 (+) Transcript_22700:476-1207(+)